MGNTTSTRRMKDEAGEGFEVTQADENIKDFIYGNHEAEICYGGEDDLHKHYTSCKKNPGHVNFIPVNDFNLGHLPSRYGDVIMLEVIKALSALTVLIKVKYTSLERPESGGCFSGQYPFYNTRGSDVLRTGTGRVCGVVKYTESENKGTCPCGKCHNSDTPSKVWGEVRVKSATHVVFDDSEARQTRCVVGFDDNKSPGVMLDGWKMTSTDTVGDLCEFSCVSCDLELVDQLIKMCLHFDDKRKKAELKYWIPDCPYKLTIIVSHPHGCHKKISLGQWTQRHVRNCISNTYSRYRCIKYTYTTCTCPGSSGATVCILGFGLWLSHAHSGTNSSGNFSVDW